MKVKMKKDVILSRIDEDMLLDQSTIESIYTIRQLRALVESTEVVFIEVEEKRQYDCAYSSKYEINFMSDLYEVVA